MKSIKQDKKKLLKCALLLALIFTLLFAATATAQARIVVNPRPMNFGGQTVGVASASMTVTLTNNSLSNIKIVGVSLSSIQFSYSGDPLPIILRPGQSLIGAVSVTPAAAQAYLETLTFTRANGMTVTDSLSAFGIALAQGPSITAQPLSQTIIAGQTTTFSVVAAGTAPLNYQWQKNATAISGATSSSYTTPAETIADNAAAFSVVVTNSVGNVTSSAAILTVNPPPVAPSITTQPLSQTITAGVTATFSVTVSGTAPMSYQWQKNATAISGAIAASYTTPAETIADNAAQFSIVVSNSVGSVTSSAAILTVNAPPVAPSITTQPLSQTIIAGQTATFSVTAAGTAPLSYQWQKNGAAMSGATSSSYTTAAETIADNAAAFSVVVTNSVGSVASSAAILTVNAPPVAPSITTQPLSQTIIAGQTATFSVTAAGTAPLNYQWQKNATAISGAIAASYTTPAETTADNSAQFSIVVTNSVGSVISIAAILTVNPPPVAPSITTQPLSQTIIAGMTATFSVAAAGTAPLSYQWRKNASTISGATSSSYTTPAETTADNAALFSVIVTNSVGSVTSSAAILTVNPPPVAPSITTQPLSQTITAGMTAMFSVTAAGTAPLSYQWRKNATAISGGTSSSYTTPAETIADNAAAFSVVLTNSVGSVASIAAILTVNAVPPGALTASTSALSFGNVNIGSNRVLGMTFTNSGSSNITISNVTISGPGFISTGVSAGLILTPGQIGTLSVTFTPAATGSVAGSVSVASNASNSPGLVALSGTGVQVISHSATLNWTASTSTVIGYNLYRGTISGGPYTKINSSIDATTTFTDAGIVQAGKTYYWVVTAVNSSNVESVLSGEVSATIPTP
jgi:hypothetical protein